MFAVLAFRQAGIWKGPGELFAQTYRVNPRSVAAAYNLGAAALNRDKFIDQIAQFIEISDNLPTSLIDR